ncbi:MAG: beta-propeller domain-containing protein [Coriobacteriales bacterium]|jgi:uncharacterized secreted protein with C-terminal beta-propeller domain|nr:beta-propeller domain-containing protein [Coriobacteriales bacterium]
MNNNIFRDMRAQMKPSAEALSRLEAALEAEPVADKVPGAVSAAAAETAAGPPPASNPAVAPSPASGSGAARTTGSSRGPNRRSRRLAIYLSAAAAFALVLIAGGSVLLSGLPFGGPKPLDGLDFSDSPSLVAQAGAVRAPADYEELYGILEEAYTARGGFYGNGVMEIASAEDAVASGAAVSDAAAGQSTAPSEDVDVPTVTPTATEEADTAAAPEAVAPGTSVAADSDYSETNTQVKGIDEADIVKTDGTHIYALTQNELAIFKADGPNTVEVSRTQLASQTDYSTGSSPREMYLVDDMLTVVIDYYHYGTVDEPYLEDASSSSSSSEGAAEGDAATSQIAPAVSEETLETRLAFYDVSDPTAPTLITQFAQSGNYRNSRVYDGTLYLISSYYLYAGMDSEDPGSFVPLIGEGEARACIAVEDIRIMPEVQQPHYTIITSYDIVGQERLDQKTVLGEAGTVYMSYDNLYLASSIYTDEVSNLYEDSVYTIEEHTTKNSTQIIRVGVAAGALDVAAQCVIDGMLLNQFSLDEYEGNLRIALTLNNSGYRILRDISHNVESYQYDFENPPQTNALYVLSPSLTVLGAIEGLAEDERIYSVRFTGSVGYMVTYRQMDPLFALDLSDPANPQVLSELKIPGFSAYLHPFGEGRLLGLGYDADGARTDGMKLSMFDVSDPFAVSELYAESAEAYDSEALYNHKAVLADAERNIIGFYGYGDSGGGRYYVYRYDDAGGFELRGALTLSTEYGYEIRGLFIGEYLYVLSGDALDVFALEDLGTVASVPISHPDEDGGFGKVMPMAVPEQP